MPGHEDISRINPMVLFGLEAAGLFGGQATASNQEGVGWLSYQAALELRADIQRGLSPHVQEEWRTSSFMAKPYLAREVVLPDELAARYDEGLQAGVIGLADHTLRGPWVSGLLVITDTLTHGWYEDDRRITMAGGHIRRKAAAVHGLAMAIAVLEGNIPPNDLGSQFDQTIGVPRKVAVVKRALQDAYEITHESDALFGNRATTQIMNAVTDRAELQRPAFKGTPVGDPFPRFRP